MVNGQQRSRTFLTGLHDGAALPLAVLVACLVLIIFLAAPAGSEVTFVSYPRGEQPWTTVEQLQDSQISNQRTLQISTDGSGSGKAHRVYLTRIVDDPGSDPIITAPLKEFPEPTSIDDVTFEVPATTGIGDYRVLVCEGGTADCVPAFSDSRYVHFTVRGIRAEPSSGQPGSRTTVTGHGFHATESLGQPTDCDDVEIRFDGLAVDEFGISSDPTYPPGDQRFSRTITVPDRPPGTYEIRALQGGSCGDRDVTTTFTIPVPPPPTEPDPQIELDPASGLAGSTTTATVSGFGESSECGEVTVTVDGDEVLSGSAVSTTGQPFEAGFTWGFTVPERPSGTYEVTATQSGCGPLSASASFTVDPGPETDAVLTVDPEEGTVDSEVEASGAEFEPSVPVVLRMGGTVLANVAGANVDSDGSFTVTFVVPEGTPGGIQDVTACQRCTDTDVLETTAEFLVLPRISIDRELARPGDVLEVTGDGFPTGGTATLSWDLGIGLETVEGDEAGEIRTLMLIFRRDTVGPRELTAEIVNEVPGGNEEPRTASEELLVQPGALSPPDFVSRK